MNGQDLDFAEFQQNHPAIQRPPHCLRCGWYTRRRLCSPDNENGNGLRPYYKCCNCGAFACFGDMRGVLAENPTCSCDYGRQLSRSVIAGTDGGEAEIPRSMFYHCATGGCRFFGRMIDDRGRYLIYDGPFFPETLMSLGF